MCPCREVAVIRGYSNACARGGEIPRCARNNGVLRSNSLLQQALDAIGENAVRRIFGNETIEQAQIGVHGDVVVGDFYGAFDRGAEQAPLRGEGEVEGRALPGSFLNGYFDRELRRGFE